MISQLHSVQEKFDVWAMRKEFPILQRDVKGYPLVYFDNAATSQKPQLVLDSLMDDYTQFNAIIHCRIHTLA